MRRDSRSSSAELAPFRFWRRNKRYSGTLSDFSFPFSSLTKRNLLSAKTRVSSFSFSSTVSRALPTMLSNFAIDDSAPQGPYFCFAGSFLQVFRKLVRLGIGDPFFNRSSCGGFNGLPDHLVEACTPRFGLQPLQGPMGVVVHPHRFSHNGLASSSLFRHRRNDSVSSRVHHLPGSLLRAMTGTAFTSSSAPRLPTSI